MMVWSAGMDAVPASSLRIRLFLAPYSDLRCPLWLMKTWLQSCKCKLGPHKMFPLGCWKENTQRRGPVLTTAWPSTTSVRRSWVPLQGFQSSSFQFFRMELMCSSAHWLVKFPFMAVKDIFFSQGQCSIWSRSRSLPCQAVPSVPKHFRSSALLGAAGSSLLGCTRGCKKL